MVFSSSYTTGSQVDYRPFWNIQCPDGFNFVGHQYPTTSPIPQGTWGGWAADANTPDASILITGFYGRIRVYLKHSYSDTQNQIPFVLRWLPANTHVAVEPKI